LKKRKKELKDGSFFNYILNLPYL